LAARAFPQRMPDEERRAGAKREDTSTVPERGLPLPPEVPPASQVEGDEEAERKARELERQDEEARGLE
jgi:hypothetical protein